MKSKAKIPKLKANTVKLKTLVKLTEKLEHKAHAAGNEKK